jgi:bleomycin hydrolase
MYLKNKILLSFMLCAMTAAAQNTVVNDYSNSQNAVAVSPDIPLTNRPGSKYQFTIVKDNSATGIKNQFHSSTCWCYSTQSFLESELMRMGKGVIPLSQMFVVHNIYLQKAIHYVRYQGHAQFGPGGEPHDVINSLRDYGLVPALAYIGLPDGETNPEMNEMDNVLVAMLNEMNKLPDGHLNPNWFKAYQGALDGYMGTPPSSFTYNGKTYTPKEFAKSMGLNPDDYVEITSFTHHPFYQKFILEVPDNWAESEDYNVPLDDFHQIVDNAIQNGYTVEWGADVSELYYSERNSLALVPQADMTGMASRGQIDSVFMNPVAQKTITQEMRQEAFDNLSTTDDHGMQIIGIAKDQNGDEFYVVKNSHGVNNYCNGYLYVSTQYFEYKTTSIMVNKNSIPESIRKKLGI